MDVDGEDGQVVRRDRGRSRAMIGRGNGMAGVTAQKKKEVRRAEARARKTEEFSKREKEWALNKQNNHQKYFHYSIL
jgi:pre-60S factor REI1